jgi:hypothetical protein
MHNEDLFLSWEFILCVMGYVLRTHTCITRIYFLSWVLTNIHTWGLFAAQRFLIGHKKNTKGLKGVPNSILDQNSGSNEFGPQFVPGSFTRVGAFTLLILSNQSLLACMHLSKTLVL